MTATFTRIPDDVVAGVQRGDEQSLQRLFVDHYDALIDEAKVVLTDPSFAARVVEAATLRTWSHRAELTDASKMGDFLQQSVHDAAVRDNGRRAGVHRLEQFEGIHHQTKNRNSALPTAQDAWVHVSAALHPPTVDSKASAAAKADMSRHAAAEHMAQVAKTTSPLVSLGYGALIIAVVAGLLFGLFRDTPAKKTARLLASDKSSEIMSKYGQMGTTTLSDGSKVKIGADSKLRIPPKFNEEVRAIAITGAAMIDVAKGGTLPFEVRMANVAVVATGTQFGVAMDTSTKTVFVKVNEGSVEVRVGEKSTPLAAGKSLAIDAAGATREPAPVEVAEALGWVDGRFVVNNRSLRLALDQTRRWYGLALVPSDMSLMDRKVSVDANLESSKEMIAGLEQSGNLKFGWEDKTMMLYDAGKPIPKPKK
jgi:transmembrane sensor